MFSIFILSTLFDRILKRGLIFIV